MYEKQAEILKVLGGVARLEGEGMIPGSKPKTEPFETMVSPSPTAAYNRRLDVMYRAGAPGHPRLGKVKSTWYRVEMSFPWTEASFLIPIRLTRDRLRSVY